MPQFPFPLTPYPNSLNPTGHKYRSLVHRTHSNYASLINSNSICRARITFNIIYVYIYIYNIPRGGILAFPSFKAFANPTHKNNCRMIRLEDLWFEPILLPCFLCFCKIFLISHRSDIRPASSLCLCLISGSMPSLKITHPLNAPSTFMLYDFPFIMQSMIQIMLDCHF